MDESIDEAANYTSMMDLNDDENDDTTVPMTQIVRTTVVEDVSATAGRILGIELENFMCHKNLSIKFNTDRYNCFYIVGPNGSGKSAIFAGLNIGLGGTGRNNNRGNALSAYIKEGETTAKIRVFISNVGENAHPDYGETIVVERVITLTGSRYMLKSNQCVKSTNKTELNNILKRFSIVLDNPLCWLSQDRAREFLSQMKPEKLYEIFMITSELIVANRNYDSTAGSIENLEILLENWKAQQITKQKAYQELLQIHKAIKGIKSCENEQKKVNWWLRFMPIKEKRIELIMVKKNVSKAENDWNELKVNFSHKEAQSTERNLVLTEYNDEFAATKALYQNLKAEKEKAILQRRDCNSHLTSLEAKQLSTFREIKMRDAQIEHSRSSMIEIMGRPDRDINAERDDVKNQIHQLEEQNESDNTQLGMLNARKIAIENEHREQLMTVRNTEQQIQSYASGLHQIQRDKQEFAQIAKDEMRRFGEHTTQILNLLERNKKHFKQMPIGPLGRYVKVKDSRWAGPIEKILKNDLVCFLCDNAGDRITFETMLRQNKLYSGGVIVSRYSDHKFDTTQRSPSCDILTVERALDIKNETVFNYFVDSSRIESIMLIENDNEARNIMQSHPPDNVAKAYTLQCSEVMPARPGRYYRFYVGYPKEARLLIDEKSLPEQNRNWEAQTAQLMEQQDAAKQQLEECQSEAGKTKLKVVSIVNEMQALQKRIDANGKKFDDLDVKLNEINNIADRQVLITEMRAAQEENQKLLDASKENMQKLEAEIEEYEVKIEEVEKDVNLKATACAEAGAKLKAIQAKIAESTSKFESLEAKLNNLRNEVFAAQTTYEESVQICDKTESELKKCEADLELPYDENDFVVPEGVSDPPDDSIVPSRKFLAEMKQSISLKLQRLQARTNGEHVTAEQLEKARCSYEDAASMVLKQVETIKDFKESFNQRVVLYDSVMVDLPKTLEAKFKEFMAMRNYVGELKVNHDKKCIEIFVQTHKEAKDNDDMDGNEITDDDEEDERPKQKKRRIQKVPLSQAVPKKRQQIQDLKGLSGGERSYTTACFVMALWTCVECPFRCLDEFDVYMDMVNRRIVMELLSELARKHRHIQFFFFTPQGITELDCGDVQVFPMKTVT